MEFLVLTAPGLEELLSEELKELGLAPRLDAGSGVRIEGDWAAAARILLRSRIASRVLHPVRAFSARTSAMLYDQVRRIDWPQWIPPGKTTAVYVHGSIEGTDYALSFAPLKIKDALCDEMKKRGVDRPNIDRHNPDVRVEAFIFDGRCEISIDLAGIPLHVRGYREAGGEAPLRENRAAALLRFIGYDGSKPFIDPFCGTATIAIEAAMVATRTAPGLNRPLEKFTMSMFGPEALKALRDERAAADRERRRNPPHAIVASDASEKARAIAQSNVFKAGFEGVVRVRKLDAREIEAPGHFIVCNPPWGTRLDDKQKAAELLSDFTRQLKHNATGSTLGLVVEAGELEKAVGFKPSKKLLLKSGELDTRFLKFDIFAGKRAASTPKSDE